VIPALARESRQTLWVPDYFCHDVTAYWRRHARIRLYRDDPARREPDWATLRPQAGEMVLAVNHFGVREAAPWRRWQRSSEALLVEDHSHDPGSAWASSSTADYAFSSLRKTLPLADGAIVWSPLGRPLPPAATGANRGAALRWKAMEAKRQFLAGKGSARRKRDYRALFARGESQLARGPVCSPDRRSRWLLVRGLPGAWRKARIRNVRVLRDATRQLAFAQPLFAAWPRGAAPLGLMLRFDQQRERDRCRQWLEAHDVYCPIHWEQPGRGTWAARRLAERLLTIPADQRYSRADMMRVAGILERFSDRNAGDSR
jgi:hypothetical protein